MKILFFSALLFCFFNFTSFAQTETHSDSIYTMVETMPQYPGGQEALMDLIKENLVYPQLAKEKGIEGKVFASFVVETDGSISNLKIIKSLGSGCDEEVLRVLGMMKKWRPGKLMGKKVRVQFNLPVKFSLT